MPTPDEYGRSIPTATESPNLPAALAAYSLSAPPGPLTVTSRAQANAIRAAAGNPTGLHVWRTDTNQEERWNGSSWEYVAGRQHGAIIKFARADVPENISAPPRSLHATSIERATPGWTMGSEARVIIPAAGAYAMSAVVNLTGAASTAGRCWFQFVATNGAIGGRLSSGPNENNHAGSLTWWLPHGTHLHVQVYHEGGGTRDYSAEVQIYMINAPSW